MKKLTIIFILMIAAVAANAQGNAGASQTTNLALSDAIDISLLTNNTVTMQFNTVNDYANGIESDDHTLLIRSNKKFNIRVKAQATKFSYSGPSTDPGMKVKDVLKMKITSNNTGGVITSGYANYKAVPTNGTKIINQGNAGGNNSISVKYQAKPGFDYPAGTYSIDVIYTATQS